MPPEGLPRRVFLLPSLLLVMATTSTSSADATRGASPSEEGKSGRGPFSPILNWLSQSQRTASSTRKGSSPTAVAGSTGTLAFAAPPSSPPTHLTVLVHGYVGTPKDLTYLKVSRGGQRLGLMLGGGGCMWLTWAVRLCARHPGDGRMLVASGGQALCDSEGH